ncbi:MAG: integral rane sensor signal transduction histidine kinase [Myxococcales bacterium]|nr:integral rane sensor signal transduction histidine kinase [Myxococcales bacterium]
MATGPDGPTRSEPAGERAREASGPSGDSALQSLATVPFKRRFVVPAVVLGLCEILFVGVPLWTAFDLGDLGADTLVRTALPIGVGAVVVWWAAIAGWLLPLWSAVVARRRGSKVNKEAAARAYRITLKGPVRVLLLRTGVWSAAAGLTGLFLHIYDDWPTQRVAELIALATVHAYVVSCIRALWWAHILSDVRDRLFAVGSPLKRFDDSHFRRFLLVAMIVAGGVVAAQATFAYYFVPITHEQYLQLETYVPVATLVGLVVWTWFARMTTADLRRYLASSRGETNAAPPAAVIYRRAQALPYRLALLTICVWFVVALVGALVCRLHLGFDLDDTIILSTATLILAVAGSIYEQLWHREVVRPLLAHLTQRYRVPVRSIAPSLSLRSKLMLSFGGVVLLACGMALLWGFVQYKNLATQAALRQSEIGLQWLRSEVQTELGSTPAPPTQEAVRSSLKRIIAASPEATAVIYYQGDTKTGGDTEKLLAVGGGPMGAPKPPWYVRGLMTNPRGNLINLHVASLTGRSGRLQLNWHGTRYDLGSVAVFYPSYRGRGESMVRPLKELLVFFLVLFGACAGIVAFTVAQFMAPIKRLEQRADAMARGELADPVAAGGEGDEIGRLTLALEEMRRALRDKLRSTEEVNLDLERAVQMRTADLARKNRELAETLDKLTRAQEQLVRSEKLASIGQLVAGIAHEINNPVNAIVNTVGPLEEAISDIDNNDPAARAQASKDVREMVKVVQRGAQRTKAIVSALHNYSRTDDESVVDFDIDRSIDDSLELLRHLLKQNVTVVKKYGDVGRVRGHAGQINQVFMNLLTNAAQALAHREAAAITIETRGEANMVEVKIRDNGSGIPADILPKIWDPFFTTKDVGEGTGLGLSIVHELVERHGGSIECETKMGEGTTFTVKLPRQMPITEQHQRKRPTTDVKTREQRTG